MIEPTTPTTNPPPATELAARLRSRVASYAPYLGDDHAAMMIEAADALDRQSARIAEMAGKVAARIAALEARTRELAEAVTLLSRVRAEVLREPREVLAFLIPQPLAREIQQFLARHDAGKGGDDGK